MVAIGIWAAAAGLPIREKAMDAAQFTLQGDHYHADAINLLP